MRNKLQKIVGTSLLVAILLAPSTSFGAYMRANQFMDKNGADRVAEIKRFQAQNNLAVSGVLNQNTKNMLNNPNLNVYDLIEKPASKGYWIAINKSRHTLTLYKGSQSVGKYPVALGSSSTPTPSGKGKVANKHVNPAWGGMNGKYKPIAANDPSNPLGERWMGISLKGYSGYGIHGTIKPGQIGQSVSNGCIRMFNYDIESYVFPIVPVGSPVWMGTDAELANWGVRQIVDEEKPNATPKKEEVKKPEEKPVEEKKAPEVKVEEQPKEEKKEAVDVVTF